MPWLALSQNTLYASVSRKRQPLLVQLLLGHKILVILLVTSWNLRIFLGYCRLEIAVPSRS